MNRHIAFVVLVFSGLIFGLSNILQNRPIELEEKVEPKLVNVLDTLKIDVSKSNIFWKGTKMMGLGKHEGEIAIQNGFLLIQNNALSGGEITVDMNTITVTDIPETDPIPIRNLTNHLKSPDFFDVDKYPYSNFQITKVEPTLNGKFQISGLLDLKGITNSVLFEAEQISEDRFSASLEIDRFDWDIAYSGNWIDRTLVDREIQLRIELVGY
ncbi:polyisoprenoid-binding protein YceI [Algoriphagus iocasae]|uniref:Polyisoprenoid-binding protein YceI n=1 Tax=Algoriphagus iocasae TaxID=1836499 RepID=A0A841MV45_9BACT|nr:YceI family protein [Algoriphagus iocasae]MBB6326458.1 polyisoprenoid-binding protein YceI [Algoriphagus iocasae]